MPAFRDEQEQQSFWRDLNGFAFFIGHFHRAGRRHGRPWQRPLFLWIALGVGVLGLIFALIMARSVLASDTGTPEMQLISNAIREGAEAFMTRQYTTIALLAVALAVASSLAIKPRPLPRRWRTRWSSAF